MIVSKIWKMPRCGSKSLGKWSQIGTNPVLKWSRNKNDMFYETIKKPSLSAGIKIALTHSSCQWLPLRREIFMRKMKFNCIYVAKFYTFFTLWYVNQVCLLMAQVWIAIVLIETRTDRGYKFSRDFPAWLESQTRKWLELAKNGYNLALDTPQNLNMFAS